jgi:hypothetical protein
MRDALRLRLDRGWVPRRRTAALAVLLFAVLLLALRPATPFEWDEVLYQRALDHYDVAAHSPHPPGVPAYIAAGKVLSYLTRDPQLAMQLVAVISALAAVMLLARLARELGAPSGAAAAAACVLALAPAFTFHANIGLSDVPATAGMAGAVLMCVLATRDTGRLPWAAAAVALALSLRPQILMALLPAGLAAVAMAVTRRRWRLLGLGALSGVGVSTLIWAPAILLTGAARYWQTALAHARWMDANEWGLRLPSLNLRQAISGWLADPLGSRPIAAAFWLLVVVGTAVWLATGRRWLVAAAGASGALYLVVAMFTMNVLSAARYGLPALALFSLLAAGVAAAPGRWARAAGVSALALWCIAAFAWGLPVYLMRREPAPAWSALEWIRDHRTPHHTRVIYNGVFTPHVRYVLGRAGFKTVSKEMAEISGAPPSVGEETLFVTEYPMPTSEILFQRVWDIRRLGPLTFRRYGSCVVSHTRNGEEPVFSPDWQVRERGWELWGTGRIRLPEGSKPGLARLCAGGQTITLHRPGGLAQTLGPGQCTMTPLLPGPGGELAVIAPPNAPALIPPIQLLPLSALDPRIGLATAYMIPQAAHLRGIGGVRWRTDLVVMNPQRKALTLTAQFLPTDHDNTSARVVSAEVAAGKLADFPDVLTIPQFAGGGTMGALLVYAGRPGAGCTDADCGFLVLARTYSTGSVLRGWRANEWLPGVPASEALRPGERARFSHVMRTDGVGASVGFVSWTGVPVTVRLQVIDRTGAVVERRELELEPFGHLHVPLKVNVEDATVEVELGEAPTDALVVPYVSMVEHESGLPSHILPDAMPEHPPGPGWRPPMPRLAAGS